MPSKKKTPVTAIGRVSSASVEKGTGKGWSEWIAILDKAGARSWTHKECVAFLKKKHKLSPWWQQGVTHGYEVHSGRRVDGENEKGERQVTATKSLAHDAKKIWAFLVSKKGQTIWLRPLFPVSIKVGQFFETEDGFFGEIRTLQSPRRARMSWRDPDWAKPTYVQIFVVDRKNKSSILAFQHEKLRSADLQEKMRARWKAALEQVGRALATKA